MSVRGVTLGLAVLVAFRGGLALGDGVREQFLEPRSGVFPDARDDPASGWAAVGMTLLVAAVFVATRPSRPQAGEPPGAGRVP